MVTSWPRLTSDQAVESPAIPAPMTMILNFPSRPISTAESRDAPAGQHTVWRRIGKLR